MVAIELELSVERPETNEAKDQAISRFWFNNVWEHTNELCIWELDGIHGEYRLVSTYDLPDPRPRAYGGGGYFGVKTEKS